MRERLNKHKYDTKNRPDNNKLAFHIHKYRHEVLILKGIYIKDKKIIVGRKIHLLIDQKTSIGVNVELKHSARELYQILTDVF